MTRDAEIQLVKGSMDMLSLTAVGGWLIGVLPAIATGLSVVWMIIRIMETKTVQRFLRWDDALEDDEPSPPNPFDPTD